MFLKLKNNIKINIRYKMNFSPKILNSNIVLNKIKANRIYCKNFIFTILVFDLFNNEFNKNFKPLNYKIHIIKTRKHVGSILRAPYKNKIAQFSIGVNRYYLTLSFSIKTNLTPKINNSKELYNLIIKLLNSYNYFESTLVTQISRNIKIPILLNIF
uniref:Ymf59 n=1 Tax=Tetrahymena rostrata TaxID=5909 RepID=A0A650DE43_TETRO|nr:Ymf59 [Tetrahymena rostrata]QGS65269.1 Ymf59 [Tetrahymena rostrata]